MTDTRIWVALRKQGFNDHACRRIIESGINLEGPLGGIKRLPRFVKHGCGHKECVSAWTKAGQVAAPFAQATCPKCNA
jgi:hypothetical protein